MYVENQLARSHGRAYRLLAVAIERTFPRLLDIPVQTDRFTSIFANWQFQHPLPNRHDLITFQLSDLRNSSLYHGDTVEWAKRTKAMHEFLPMLPTGQCLVEQSPISKDGVFTAVPEPRWDFKGDMMICSCHCGADCVADDEDEIEGEHGDEGHIQNGPLAYREAWR
jgi:hypothetical protein